jgi:hypothetical protein
MKSPSSKTPRRTVTAPRPPLPGAGRVPRAGDAIEEEEMSEAQADGRVHAPSGTPTIAPGRRGRGPVSP